MEIVPAHLAVKAMRDSGYKNAAYAIAELIDNSIQAGARNVDLICFEKTSLVRERETSRISKIIILDDGSGMDSETLQMALQFGNGSNLEPDKQIDMGKFGMGLPASSVSQAARLDVWSWQSGIETALHTQLDIAEIIGQRQTSVPKPKKKKIPDELTQVIEKFSRSGTVVVWSSIDRCIWKTGKAIIENSEFVIGRMYRKFLATQKVSIRMRTFDEDDLRSGPKIDRAAVANDPLYLLSPSSTPEPYGAQPMFEPYPNKESYDHTITVRFRGRDHKVHIRTSIAKIEARREGTAGSRKFGRHAEKNLGVSIVRAKRELELDKNWAQQGEARDRWWGVEVDFPPALDDLFGVNNNKQSARNFADMAFLDIDELVRSSGAKTVSSLKEEWAEEGDPRGPLLEVAQYVQSCIQQMRGQIKVQLANSRTRDRARHDRALEAEREATDKTRQRQSEGKSGESDSGEGAPERERQDDIARALEGHGLDAGEATILAARTVHDSLKYTFAEAAQDSPAFFSVQPKGGTIIVTLNTRHPAYDRLVDVLESGSPSAESPEERLENALTGLKLLLMAWARYEDEQPAGVARERVQEARVDWGKIARRFMDRSGQ